MSNETNSWAEWSRHVLIELERLWKYFKELDNKLENHVLSDAKSITEITESLKQAKMALDECKLKMDHINAEPKNKDVSDNALIKLGETAGKSSILYRIVLFIILSIIISGMLSIIYLAIKVFLSGRGISL